MHVYDEKMLNSSWKIKNIVKKWQIGIIIKDWISDAFLHSFPASIAYSNIEEKIVMLAVYKKCIQMALIIFAYYSKSFLLNLMFEQ